MSGKISPAVTPAPENVSKGSPGVDEPGRGAVLLHLFGQHSRVLHGVPHKEGPAKACAEGCLGLCDSHLGSGHLHVQRQMSACNTE